MTFAMFHFIAASPQSDDPPKKTPTTKALPAKPHIAASGAKIAIPDIPYTKFVLANGLTVLVHEDHKAPIVAVNTWYHVGSKNEKPGKTGFAHLFEHLMFSGSENFNYTYINAMERIGATNLNGTTNGDRTNYFENVPTSMLDYVLFAESDRMGHLLGVLDQKKLDLQRGVVQNEKRQGENQPYGVTRQLLTENTYPVGHPYSWTTIGSMTDLDAASLTDVQEWFKTYYGPNNVTVVIAGDITPEVARQKVEKYYGGIPPGPPVVHRQAWIAKRTGTHRDSVQDRVPQARLSIASGTCLRQIHPKRRRSIWLRKFSARAKRRVSTNASFTKTRSPLVPPLTTATARSPASSSSFSPPSRAEISKPSKPQLTKNCKTS
jgi:zinc protease